MTLGRIILELGNAYTIIILIYCIATWIPPQRDNVLADIERFLAKICDPYLDLFRKFIPPIGGTVDVSPVVAIIVLQLLVSFIARLI